MQFHWTHFCKDQASKFTTQQAFMIMYNIRGRIIYMQYAKDGKIVTFNGQSFSVGDQTKFNNFR